MPKVSKPVKGAKVKAKAVKPSAPAKAKRK
jgi:hypothetical protein